MTSGFFPRETLAGAAAERPDDAALRGCLERIVATRCHGHGTIETIDRRPCQDGSSYAAEVVTLTLGNGEALEVFVKYFGSSRYHKQEPRLQAERELRVYRDVLAGADLGTAEYLDSLRDESCGRHWLFLEYVRGTPLAYRAFDDWIAAARWLARLHRYFADHADRLSARRVLLTHDAGFFSSAAERALSAVASISPPLADRLSAVVDRQAACVDVMAAQRPTIVHGAFKPRHVLVDGISTPPRLCPIDWELAATGSNLYDLAFLADGLGPAAVDRLLDAYRDEAFAHDLPLAGRAWMRSLVDCFRLHRILKALCRAEERAFPEQRIEKAIESGERLVELVC